jgi:excisionase family DNA binding protein
VSVLPLPAGHGEGTVAARTRVKSGDSKGAGDSKSSAPAGLLTIQDVAGYTKVSYWTVRGWIESGKLPVLRLPGRLIRIRPAALEAFLARECGS